VSNGQQSSNFPDDSSSTPDELHDAVPVRLRTPDADPSPEQIEAWVSRMFLAEPMKES